MTFARLPACLLAIVTGCLTVGAALAAPAGAAPAPSPWLQPGFNGANANANPAESTLTPASVTKARLQHTLGVAGDNQCDRGGPGAVFSQSNVYAVYGSRLTKFDLSTGRTVWTNEKQNDDEDYTQIFVSHGLAIVAGNECGTNDPNGDIEAYRTSDGKPVWFALADGDGIAAVQVSGKYVVAETVTGLESSPQFHVFDVQTGKPVWSTSDATVNNLCDIETGGVVDGLVYERWCPGGDASKQSLRAVAVGTGKPTWSKAGGYTELRGDSDATGAHHLYVRNDATGAVLDVNPKSGATRGTLAGATDVFAVDPNRLYGPCGTHLVCAWSVADNHLVWRAADPNGAGSAVVGGSVVYLGDGLVLNAGNGHKITTLASGPALVGSGHLGYPDAQNATVLVYGV